MKLHKPVGSKERLVEIFKNVNKLNEELRLESDFPNNDVVSRAVNGIISGDFTVTNSDSMSKNDGLTYLDLTGKDSQNNVAKLNLVVPTEQGDIDGVFSINDAELKHFQFRSADGQNDIELDENGLAEANQNNKDGLIELAGKYVTVDTDGTEDVTTDDMEVTEEMYEEAVKWIDTVPYQGGTQRMQTSKAYGDQKPVNPKLRAGDEEFNKFVNEMQNEEENKSNYPDQMGKTFKPKSNYPKKKKKIQTTVKIGEATDQDKYEDVVFMQGEEADEALDILKNQGEDAAMQHLMQWHDAGNHMGNSELGHGSSDRTYEKDGYIMSWNFPLGYIGLQYDLSQMNEGGEEDVEAKVGGEPEEAPDVVNFDAEIGDERSDVEKENPELYPDGWKEMDGMHMGPDAPNPDDAAIEPDWKAMGMEIGGDWDKEQRGDDAGGVDIEQLMQDKEEAGDQIAGGLADNESPEKFCPVQLAKGIKVEMEHTDDPLIAMEIVMDHLMEDPKYYGDDDEDPEAMAQQGAEADAGGDDEIADELLGFSPHNVGEIPDTPEDQEDKEETDTLLGYSPQNVGDYEGGEEEEPLMGGPQAADPPGMKFTPPDEEEEVDEIQVVGDTSEAGGNDGTERYQGGAGDKYEDAEGNRFTVTDITDTGVGLRGDAGAKEIATRDLQFMKKLSEGTEKKIVLTEELIKTARQALNKRGVGDGMTKKEAVQILIMNNIK